MSKSDGGYRNGSSLPGWFLTGVIVIGTAIGGSLFSHESRISKAETAIERIDRLERKIDRVLELLGAAHVSP